MSAKLLDGSATFRPARFRKTAPNRPAFLAKAVALGLIALFGGAGAALAGTNGPFTAVRADHANLPTIVVADNMVVYTPTGAATNLNLSGDITNLTARGLARTSTSQGVTVWSAVKYLSDGIYQMTGQRLPVASHNTYPLNNAIMLTTLEALTNSPNAPADVVSKAKAALIDDLDDPYTKLYDRSEAFYIHTEASGIYIVANNFSGLGHAVVELLEGGHAVPGYQIGYETLGMGPNWTYTPNFTAKYLIFNMEYSSHPGFYLRVIAPEWGAAGGMGTISYGYLKGADNDGNGLHAPDEPVEVSYDHWQRGLRVANQNQSMPNPPSQGGIFPLPILDDMVARRSTKGLIAPVQYGLYANRPAASSNNLYTIYFATDRPATATNAIAWCVGSGANYYWFETPLNGVRSHVDLSVPEVRAIFFERMKKQAEAFWVSHPGQIYSLNVEPGDAGPDDDLFVRCTAYKNWYPEYRQAEGQPWGAYKLSGSPVGPQPNQATESWWWNPADPAHPDSANAYSDTLMAFNNWLLREFDKYVNSLPAANRLSGGISKKELIITSCLSYYFHDVPPNFNLDRRVRVTVSFFTQHRGKGKWTSTISYPDRVKAYSMLSPQPGIRYALLSQSVVGGDWGVDQCIYSGASLGGIWDLLDPLYEAGGKGGVWQMDLNFGKSGLDFYLFSKKMWDPELTMDQFDALRTRWITRAYGANAAGVMKQYHDYMVYGNFLNTPNTRGRAINLIQQADALIAPGTPEQRRLDDLKQFWYYYYLQDVGVDNSLPEFKELLWKGQMSYMNPLVTLLYNVFKDVRFDAVERIASPNFFNTNVTPPFVAAAHYEPSETAGWWANVVRHWPMTPVNEFDNAVLADGTHGSDVDLNDLVGVQQFRTNALAGCLSYVNEYLRPQPLTRARLAGDVIGFQVYWAATNADVRRLPYSVSRWDAAHQQWTNVWNGYANSAFTTGAVFVTTADPAGRCQRIVASYTAPVAGVYRFDLDPICALNNTSAVSLFNIRVSTLDYDLAGNTMSGASIPQGFTSNRRNDTSLGTTYFYIPKGTTSLDLESYYTLGSEYIALYTGLPGNGNWTPTRTVNVSAHGLYRIPLNPGEAGSVARLGKIADKYPQFYSIPLLWATSPSLLMVPRAIAVADGLTPYTGAPVIVTPPTNLVVSGGQPAALRVTAVGMGALTYQWRKNGVNIAGATAANYTTPAITAADNGAAYSVVVANAFGSATSSSAILTVKTVPAIAVQPAGKAVTVGQTAAFSVTATGQAPLAYQWRKNGTNIAGATASSYTTPATVAGDNGAKFSVVVTNTLGSATSANAILTVNSTAPAITVQPVNKTVTAGQAAAFSVTATGLAPLKYQWRRNGANIAAATNSSYTTPATVSGDNGAAFSVVVLNSFGSVVSANAILTVNSVPPAITAQPTNLTVTGGETAVFKVTASGMTPLAYQWRRNGVSIPGATAAAYTTPATVAGDNGAWFGVVVTNAAGIVVSANAMLTVNSVPPTIAAQPVSKTVTAYFQTATFGVIAAGTAPFTYQWRRNGVNISGATSSSYTTPITVGTDNGAKYSVVVANAAGNVTSADAILTVNSAPPAITDQPMNRSVTAGQTVAFSVTAVGTTPMTYQWRKNGVNIAGATAASYTTPATTVLGDNGAKYSVKVTNARGSATSVDAILKVTSAPVIEDQPENVTVKAGQSATFSVTATGTAPLMYRWQKNGTNLGGATAWTASYMTPPIVAGDSGAKFRVVVSNSLGVVTSANATLT
ncbi:MAG: hypothetical protein WC381_03500, partial [Kiritimatiellia bacterium]